MDWRNKLIVNSVLNNLISDVESENVPQTQTGGGENPDKAVFEWQVVKTASGRDVSEAYWRTFKRNQLRAKFNIKHNFVACRRKR